MMLIMKGHKSRQTVFILLLAFCGQVLASPFLNCCASLDQSEHSSHMPDSDMQHGMMMDVDPAMHSHHHDMNMASPAPALQHEAMPTIATMTMSADCNHQCEFCLAMASSLVSSAELFVFFEEPTQSGFRAVHTYLSTLSDSLYRPPITT
jgi:hypothetical protein